jgi:murein DD-endopeptidase / murein LD-carboxypeptidase
MKHLFFVALAIFPGVSNTVSAQASINMEKLSEGTNTHSTKFIEGIEIKAAANAASTAVIAPAKKKTPRKAAAVVAATEGVIESCSALQFKYAQLMDVDVESIRNASLFGFLEDWWGTRYRYGGKTKEGIDCSAFSGALMAAVFGFALPRTAREQYQACEKIEKADLQQGDLVFFNTRGGISHVGVYLGNSHFAHSSTSEGVTISSLEENYYSKKFVSGGRMAAN